jgi:hypothetical protein
MKLLHLPVKVYNINQEEQDEMDKLEGLGLTIDEEQHLEDITLYVNPEHVVCFNAGTDPNVTVVLLSNSGLAWRVYLPLDEFIELL